MARKKKIDIGLSKILGSQNGFVSSEDLIGSIFTIISFKYEKVKGYDSQAMKIEIEQDGEPITWSTFSKVVQEQVEKLKEAKAIPCEVKLVDVPSKNKRHGNYLRLTEPE